MKSQLAALTAVAVCMALWVAGCTKAKQYTTDVNALPAVAQKTVADHYSAQKVAQIKIESDEYEITFTDGTMLEFNRSGAIKEVDPAPGDTVPSSLLPAAINDYLRANYSGQKVIKYDSGHKDDEVKVSSGIELKFDKQGKFLRID